MNGWILYNKKDYKRNSAFSDMLIDEGKKKGIDLEVLLVENIRFGVKNNELYFSYSDKLKCDRADFVISRTIFPMLTRHFEMMGIPVFNNSIIASICNDKARTYQYIASKGIKTINTSFIKREYLANFIKEDLFEYEKVIKIVDGHGGSEVFLYNEDNKKEINKYLLEANKDIVYQERIGNGSDLRVYVLDNKIVASVLRKTNDGFKANFSQGGKVSLYKLDKKQEDTVKRVIDLFSQLKPYSTKVKGLSFVGIDFILDDNNEMYFNEVEDVVGSRMLYICSDIDIVKMFMDYIKKEINSN